MASHSTHGAHGAHHPKLQHHFYSMAQQLEGVGESVGRDGRTRQRVRLGVSSGAWGDMEQSINTLIDDLLWPTTEVARALAAVAQGNLSQTMRLDVDGRPLQGEFLR